MRTRHRRAPARVDEIKLSVKEQYVRLRKTKRYKEIHNNWKDLGNNSKPYRDHEIKSFVDYEKKMAAKLRASKEGEAGDAIIAIGPDKGMSIDAVSVSRDAITRANKARLPEKRFLPSFKNSIRKHFNKIDRDGLDFVVIDFSNIDEFDKIKIIEYINTEFKAYIKQGRLIKLNE
ncbi:hypothetical protein [Olleya sp. R77988]|uniref:hypothetical protein n=1 Tax=Olleya sp. R77988 TaxID=3093875 RepID=UPI0037CB0F70